MQLSEVRVETVSLMDAVLGRLEEISKSLSSGGGGRAVLRLRREAVARNARRHDREGFEFSLLSFQAFESIVVDGTKQPSPTEH